MLHVTRDMRSSNRLSSFFLYLDVI